ncbi:MAG TPA: helix-turn-helix domain-containing GNAT family N-acetyltransferase, partial [Casimicrobiaceae bacterium]
MSFPDMRKIDRSADAVRAFNRFYTRRIGVLDDAHLGSDFSLGEMRIIYELSHRTEATASEIGDALGLDRGYLSRTLRSFKKRGLVAAERGSDRRTTLLRLTPAGRRAFAPLERRARAAVVEMLAPLDAAYQNRLFASMQNIRIALGDPSLPAADREPYVLRTHRPGDMGWIVHRHGVLYAAEFGYDERFEALVAKVVAGFIEKLDAGRERCWIAERNGEIVGSVFVVSETKRVAKLRLLLVEPSARGLGIGRRLIDECIRFAQQAGYRKLTLWTQSELDAARRLYQQAGFRCVQRKT